MIRLIRVAVFVACSALAATVAAQDFQAGLDAYEAQDYATAIENWRPLAELGHADAQSHIRMIYLFGRGVPQDHAEAARWYQMAAEQGNVGAQFALGYLYQNGRGVLQDDAEAARWYRMAAERGNVGAQASIGAMYLTGQGVLQDDVLAHMWFNIAAANGYDRGAEFRETVENDMTRQQIADAQARARVCMSSGYQDCD